MQLVLSFPHQHAASAALGIQRRHCFHVYRFDVVLRRYFNAYHSANDHDELVPHVST